MSKHLGLSQTYIYIYKVIIVIQYLFPITANLHFFKNKFIKNPNMAA